MTDQKFKIPYILISAVVLIAVFSCGAFALSGASHDKREISKEIASYERQINNLRRTNDELTLKIAEQINPIRLMKKATSKLIQPNLTENIVWAYENFDGGRVVRSYKKTDNTLSFKMPTKKNRHQ